MNAWYRRLAALFAGALAATGFAPLGLWPATLVAVAVLLGLLTRANTPAQAMLFGWLFGIGHFVVGNGWIATAFRYQAEMPAWLGWVGVFLLSLYLAVFPALAALAGWALWRRGAGRPAVLVCGMAAAWIIAEILRASVFTGYAWNPLAMVALGGFERPGLALSARWLGTYALSGLVVLLAGSWWWAAQEIAARRIGPKLSIALLPPALFLVTWPAPGGGDGSLAMTLAQPDIRQEALNDPATFEDQFVKIVNLSLPDPDRQGEPRLVLWPESGVPDYLRPGYPARYYRRTTFAADPEMARQRIAQVLGPDSLLLTGTIDLVIDAQASRARAAENVVTALGPDGKIAGGYVKSHLVPYGEYLPMRALLEPIGLSRLVAGTLDFRAGPGPRTLPLGPWGNAGIQICYEIVFSGEVVDPALRPDYIVNPSNDGWFGPSGPPQHLAQARMRAIEEGLPVLRATTTGISAVIDAGGVVRHHAPMHVAQRIDTRVPPALPPTLFARLGNFLPLAWATALFAIAIVLALRTSHR